MSLKEKYSADNPANRVRPTLAFAFSHPAHALALFFGAGCMRPAPGTWGTAAGVLVWIALISLNVPLAALIVLTVLAFVAGAWASHRTGIDLGVEDAGCIVIDEVAAVWLVLLMLPQNWIGWLAAFISFRVFDIVKLPPASTIDARMKNGIGVMLDDLFAAIWAIAAVMLLDAAVNRLAGPFFLGLY
jgi:phosphatidylglycerophosphatase A